MNTFILILVYVRIGGIYCNKMKNMKYHTVWTVPKYLPKIINRLNLYKYTQQYAFGLVWFMVFNAILNNISVISWRSILLLEETGVPGENHRPVANHWQTLSHNIVSSSTRHERSSNSPRCPSPHPLTFKVWYRYIKNKN